MFSLVEMEIFITVQFILRADEQVLQNKLDKNNPNKNKIFFLHGPVEDIVRREKELNDYFFLDFFEAAFSNALSSFCFTLNLTMSAISFTGKGLSCGKRTV